MSVMRRMVVPVLAAAAAAAGLIGSSATASPAPESTWGTPSQAGTNVNDLGIGSLSFLTNAQGTRALLAWTDRSGRVHTRMAVISGSTITWGDDTFIATSAATLSVDFSANGQTAIVGWRMNGGSTNAGYAVGTIDDSSVRWGDIGTVPTTSGIPMVAVSDDGSRVAVAFTTDNNPWPLKVRAGAYASGSVTWSSDVDVSGVDPISGIQRIAMSGDGATLVMTYFKNTGKHLWMAPVSVSWTGSPPVATPGTPVNVSGIAAYEYQQSLAISGDGQRVAVSWQDNAPNPDVLRTRAGAITANAITLGSVTTNGPTLWTAPSVSLDDSGATIVTSWQGTASEVIAQVGSIDDSTPIWDDSVALLTTDVSSQSLPALALSQDGRRALIVARQGSPGSTTMKGFIADIDAQGATWDTGEAVSSAGTALVSAVAVDLTDRSGGGTGQVGRGLHRRRIHLVAHGQRTHHMVGALHHC